MAHIEIRNASPEDRDAVLAFCVNTWEWGDYIEYVWDEWLHDPNGLLLVATVENHPVGLAHMQMLNETEAWLEGMRVDPNYRHQGVAAALNNAQLAEAIRRGATITRLMTESTNEGAIRLIERSLMRRVAAFAPFKAMPLMTVPKRPYGLEKPVLATSGNIDEIIDYLNISNIFPAAGGLYYHDFIAYSITHPLLEAKVAAQHVYLLRRWDRLDGLAIAERWRDKYLNIGYIDGTTESISLIAYALRQQLTGMGLNSIYAQVPDLMMVRDAFVGAEYEWDGKVFYTYERGLV